jgi:hypothetical protein
LPTIDRKSRPIGLIFGLPASSTFLVGKRAGMVFSGGEYDTGKDVSTDTGAG